MIGLIARRVVAMAAVMLVASVCLFLLFELDPQGVAVNALGAYSTPEQRNLWLAENGYDRPAAARYVRWLGGFVTGDLGMSRSQGAPVASVVWSRLGNTALLGALFFAIMIPLALLLGVVAGMREGSWLDRIVSGIAIVSTSVPTFATTVLVSALLVFKLQLLPGTSSMMDGFSWRELVMPVLVLALADIGYVARITRASMAEVMQMPYIRAARLKGIPYRRVVLRHALRNALIAPFTVVMLHVNWIIAGVVVVEFFFAYKGFGSLILQASLSRDLYLLEACTMIAVAISVGTQTIADLGYTWLNPRIRFR
jgi:peptide/nickel transport system permease protein